MLAVSIVNAEIEQAPSLTLDKAAQIAQQKLDDLHLSSDNFLSQFHISTIQRIIAILLHRYI